MSLLQGNLLALIALTVVLLVGMAAVIWFAAAQVVKRRTPDPSADPAELGLDYEPVSFPSRDGLVLGGWFIPGSEPSRGAVIFCHGHDGSLDPDLRYVPAFHRRGLGVLQFDFRAHGRSKGQHVSMGYYERLDLLGAVDLLQQRGFGQAGVLGFSMGGAVAISTAAECPAIAAVVSDGGFARIQPTLQAGLRQRGLPLWLSRVLAPFVVRAAGWRLGCDLTEADPVRWIGQVSPRPVLLIYGEKDRYVPLAEIENLHAAAGNPKELWIVQDADHRTVDRARPEEYLERVIGFFECWLAEEAENEPLAGR
jgi:pimeloyl-ACP methyl ester carboxylesterase